MGTDTIGVEYMDPASLYIGTAGWAIPKAHAERFPTNGSHLQRYGQVLCATEINSSFYRPHRPATYERWSNSVPDYFRFAVKMPKVITHTRRLKDADEEIGSFLSECSSLGTKLGPMLVQLPPSLFLDVEAANAFFASVRARFRGDIACEPRHATWFTPEADSLLSNHRVARVAADPGVLPEASVPGGWDGLVYYRLHGSPRIYYSAYSPEYLSALAQALTEARAAGSRVWCIFDNTAEGAATRDALRLVEMTAAGNQ